MSVNRITLQSMTGIVKAVLPPWLLAIFPILALHSFNVEFVHYSVMLRSLAWASLASLLLFFSTLLIMKKAELASAISSLFVILFFSYQHVLNLLNAAIGREIPNLLLSTIWLSLFLLGIYLLFRSRSRLPQLNSFLLVAGLVLLVFNLYTIVSFEIAKDRANQLSRENALRANGELPPPPGGNYPDIYYIVLDGHARSDVLLRRFDFDNSEFVQGLEALGFYVAQCSQANYWRTEFSVGSTLSMEYFGEDFADAEALPDWEFSESILNLRARGYSIVNFESRAILNQQLGEDLLLSRRKGAYLYESIYPFSNLNDFESLLIQTTWLQSWLQLLGNYAKLLPDSMLLDAENAAYLEHYRQTLYILDELPRVPYLPGPKFVYVHILVPHEPFVFEANGQYHYRHTDNEFKEGYRNNAQFIDAQLLPILEELIANSAEPPIILMQGDHGPNGSPPATLLPILNAYYFPGEGQRNLYPTISPVNSFRLLFDEYLGMDYGLLEDRSYYGRGTDLNEAELTENLCLAEG